MTSSASSKGPGIGARPSAASPRSGRGMRLSVAAIFTARRVLLRLLMDQRDLKWGDLYRTVLGFVRAAERRRRVASYTTRRSGKVAVHGGEGEDCGSASSSIRVCRQATSSLTLRRLS